MATHFNKVLDHLHRVLAPPGSGQSDGQLLARFIAARDEAAFAALVRRHGPMVLGVCRRLLRHAQDAEDCFQATFLVLARKASAVQRESVGSWLYAVAYRTSLEARANIARRRARERQVEDMPHPEVMPVEAQDWRPWLDQELSRLPENYRAVIVACDLEGLSRKEAARLLGLAEGTISSRLARGRRLLASRLTRHGVSLSGGVLALALSEGTSAAVPMSLVSSTVKTALLLAAGQLAAGMPAAVLMRGVLKTMFLAKLKLAVGAVMVVTALGASGLIYRATGQPAPAERRSEAKPRTELETLRRENELLKLNLEVVLEKVRAQEAELRALRGHTKSAGKTEADRRMDIKKEQAMLQSDVALWEERAAWSKRMAQPDRLYVTPAQAEADRARLLSARQALEIAHEKEDMLRAVGQLESALEKLRQQLKNKGLGDIQREMLRAVDELERALEKQRQQLKKLEGDSLWGTPGRPR